MLVSCILECTGSSKRKKFQIKATDRALEEASENTELVERMQRQYQCASDLADAIKTYIGNPGDPTAIREWFTANKPLAEYEAATCFVGTRFSEFECLPDNAEHPTSKEM